MLLKHRHLENTIELEMITCINERLSNIALEQHISRLHSPSFFRFRALGQGLDAIIRRSSLSLTSLDVLVHTIMSVRQLTLGLLSDPYHDVIDTANVSTEIAGVGMGLFREIVTKSLYSGFFLLFLALHEL